MDFYGHQFITRNIIVSFMDFFSRIKIEKYGAVSVSGDEAYISRKIIPVPIQWATREKWVELLRSASSRRVMDPNIREKNPVEMQWILPRLSVNMSGLNYDATRRLVKTQDIGTLIKNPESYDTRPRIYTPVPYNINLELTSISRHLDDNMQIMEQILPFFSPSLSLSMKLFPDRELESIPIILNSVTTDNPIDLPENNERIFTNTYNFTVRANYFHIPIPDQYTVQTIDTNLVVKLEETNINVQWLEDQQKIQTRFNNYILTSDIPNPFL